MAHSFSHPAYEAFEEIRIDYVKSTAFRPETSLIAQEKLDTLEPLSLKYDSFTFVYYYFAVKEAIYSSKHDWKSVISVCNETLNLVQSKPFTLKFYKKYRKQVLAVKYWKKPLKSY